GAAPFLVLARPSATVLRGLPPALARTLVLFGGRLRPAGRFLVDPWVAWIVHAVVLWAWHAPALFERALHQESVHALQHASFLGAALLFWESVLNADRPGAGLV